MERSSYQRAMDYRERCALESPGEPVTGRVAPDGRLELPALSSGQWGWELTGGYSKWFVAPPAGYRWEQIEHGCPASHARARLVPIPTPEKK